MSYIDEIERFRPLCEQEQTDQPLMLAEALRLKDALLLRQSALMHMTASSMIVNASRDKVLMAYHNIYQSWAWTGGHADGDGNLLAVAMREAGEETGIRRLHPIQTEAISLEVLDVPQHMKRGRFVNAHLHFNLTYALLGEETDDIAAKPDENARVGWLPICRLDEFVQEKDMLKIYRKILARIS